MSMNRSAGDADRGGDDRSFERPGADVFARLIQTRLEIQTKRDRQLDRARAKRWLRDHDVLLVEETVDERRDAGVVQSLETVTVAMVRRWSAWLGWTMGSPLTYGHPEGASGMMYSLSIEDVLENVHDNEQPRPSGTWEEMLKTYLAEISRRSRARWLPVVSEHVSTEAGQHVSMRFYDRDQGLIRSFYKSKRVLDIENVSVRTHGGAPRARLLDLSLDPVDGLSMAMLFEGVADADFDPAGLVVTLDGSSWDGLEDLRITVNTLEDDRP